MPNTQQEAIIRSVTSQTKTMQQRFADYSGWQQVWDLAIFFEQTSDALSWCLTFLNCNVTVWAQVIGWYSIKAEGIGLSIGLPTPSPQGTEGDYVILVV